MASRRRTYAAALTALALLFMLRVVGQLLVAAGWAPFLPPMDRWYSGLIPYHVLVPIQIAILLLQAKMCADLWRGRGWFFAARPGAGQVLKLLSVVYFSVMLVRYVLTVAIAPEHRWLGGGTIPIVFHWVLAAYLYVYARWLGREPRATG